MDRLRLQGRARREVMAVADVGIDDCQVIVFLVGHVDAVQWHIHCHPDIHLKDSAAVHDYGARDLGGTSCQVARVACAPIEHRDPVVTNGHVHRVVGRVHLGAKRPADT